MGETSHVPTPAFAQLSSLAPPAPQSLLLGPVGLRPSHNLIFFASSLPNLHIQQQQVVAQLAQHPREGEKESVNVFHPTY